MPLLILIITILISYCNAGPNPVTDNESDDSLEETNYYYYFTDEPYWKAYSSFLKRKLKKHDSLERMLKKIRQLDFKLREAWTVNDKPFTEHH